MALPTPPPYTNPIQNNPFYAPLNPYVCGPYFPVAIGAGIDLTTGATVPSLVNEVQNVLSAGPGIALTTFLGVTTITATGGGGGGIPCSLITAKGDMIVGTAANTPTALPVGATDGDVLTVCAACTEGVTWAPGGGGGGTPATPIVEGIVYGCTDCVNFNYGLGDNIFSALTTGTLNIAIGAGALGSTDAGTSNTAVGIGALFGNTSGVQNVALGQQALFTGTTGGLNTAIGSQALQNTTGSNNTALGNFAGNLVTTGCFNILIGDQAGGAGGGALDSGDCNVVIGNRISVANNAGSNQLAIGMDTFCWLSGTSTGAIKPGAGIIDCAASTGTAGQVLMSNGANAICWGTAGGASAATPTVAGIVLGCTTLTNSALGCNALSSNTTGTCNTAIGVNALPSNTSGNDNIAIGVNTLYTNTNGEENTAIGKWALYANTSGSGNTASGFGALICNTTGIYNTANGWCALTENTDGECNTAIGAEALCNNTTGYLNVAVGFCAMQRLTTGSGNIGIGHVDSAGDFVPVFDVTTENNRIAMGSTSVTNAYVQVAWTVTSDARDKTNVTALPVGLDFVNQLNPISFQFKESRECDTATGPVRYGFLAQEVLAAEGENPVIVDTEVPEHLKVTNDHFNAVLVKAIQELSAQNKALEARIAQLEANG